MPISSVDQLENKLHELSERWLHSESFLKPAGFTLKKTLEIRARYQGLKKGIVSSFGIAIHEDLERMHQRVDELERALERAQDRLDEREQALQALNLQFQSQTQVSTSSTKTRKSRAKNRSKNGE